MRWLSMGATKPNGEAADVPTGDNGDSGDNDDDAPCHRCGATWWEPGNEMLLCDGEGCEKAFHMLCLPRRLANVPEGDWLCPVCDPDTAQHVSQLSIPLDEARRLIRQNRKAMAPAGARLAHSSRPLQAMEAVEEVSDDDQGAPCEACHRVQWRDGNEMLLCDGEGCEKAYHMLCLPQPLASVPEGDWLCPSCEAAASASAPVWDRSQELAMQLEGADRVCWACDRHGLWGKARVLRVERHGGERCTARVSFSGFSKKYDEDIVVGDGRLRPLELGPHDAAASASHSDNVFLIDRVLEVSEHPTRRLTAKPKPKPNPCP
jgi:hypothetical protein